jgi:hypothetical protein
VWNESGPVAVIDQFWAEDAVYGSESKVPGRRLSPLVPSGRLRKVV